MSTVNRVTSYLLAVVFTICGAGLMYGGVLMTPPDAPATLAGFTATPGPTLFLIGLASVCLGGAVRWWMVD